MNNNTLRERTFNRLAKSIKGEKTDRHSVFNYYTFPFFQSLTGVNLDKYFHFPKITFETQLEVFEKLNKCGSFAPDTGCVAETNALGGEVYFDDSGFINVHEAKIENIEDIKQLKVKDPYDNKYMKVGLECLEYMVKHCPKDYKVNQPNIIAPFTVAAQLRGVSNFCMDTLLNPDLVYTLLDITTETCIKYLKSCENILGGHLHHLLLSDDLSSFLDPQTYSKYVVETYKKIFAEFPQSQYWLHNDAEATHIAEIIGGIGFHAWQYAPSLDSMETLKVTKGKVSLMGGLSPLTLQKLSAQETYNLCIEKLQSFEGNTKMVLGVGGSVNQIPIENLLAMFKSADDYIIF